MSINKDALLAEAQQIVAIATAANPIAGMAADGIAALAGLIQQRASGQEPTADQAEAAYQQYVTDSDALDALVKANAKKLI